MGLGNCRGALDSNPCSVTQSKAERKWEPICLQALASKRQKRPDRGQMCLKEDVPRGQMCLAGDRYAQANVSAEDHTGLGALRCRSEGHRPFGNQENEMATGR